MGNSYSVAQEEQEEAEFERLVRAVERAERGSASPKLPVHDLEAQYHHAEAEGKPPRSEKVMQWFKSRRDNRVPEPEVQSVHAYMSPVAPVFPPACIVPEQTLQAHSHQASYQPAPSPLQATSPPAVICPPIPPIAPTVHAMPSASYSRTPSRLSRLSMATSSDSSLHPDSFDSTKTSPAPIVLVTPQSAITPPREDENNRSDHLVNSPPPFTLHTPLPAAPVQPTLVASEHVYLSLDHPSVTVGPPPATTVTLPGPTVDYVPSRSPSPSLSGSRSEQDLYRRRRLRPRSRSWEPRPPPRDSLENFRDLFYRPTPQHERTPSPDVSRGRTLSRRPVQSERTSHAIVAPAGPENSEPRVRASPTSRDHSWSPSRAPREHDSPSSSSRSRLSSPPRSRRNFRRRVNSTDLKLVFPSRKPDDHCVYPRPLLRRPSVRSQVGGERRTPSPRSSTVQYRISTARWSRTPGPSPPRPHSVRSRPPSIVSGGPCSDPKSPARSPSPLYIRRVGMRARSRSPCRSRRDSPPDPYYDEFRRRDRVRRATEPEYSRSAPPARRPLPSKSSHDVHDEPPLQDSNPRAFTPQHCLVIPPSLGSSTVSDAYSDIAPPALSSVASRISTPPSPIGIIPPPFPLQPAAPPPPSRTPRTEPNSDRFEQVLRLYEKTLEDHERRAQLWHEHSTQLVGVVRRLEKHLVALRWHRPGTSADSLPLSILDEKFGISDEHDNDNEKGAGVGVQVQSLAYTKPQATRRPYPSRPYAAGLPVRRCSDDWAPKWDVFPLKAFRGSSYMHLRIEAGWDDAALLRELGRSYDRLRTVWRKWFSLRSVRSISMVYADHTCVYPRRIGPAAVSPSKNMRLRYFLRHPEQMKGRHEFMQVLTARTDLGIEFVEGWQLSRIAVAILLPVLASLVLAVLYSALYGDVSGAFTIAGYMTSAYSVCLVLLGLLNFVEF